MCKKATKVSNTKRNSYPTFSGARSYTECPNKGSGVGYSLNAPFADLYMNFEKIPIDSANPAPYAPTVTRLYSIKRCFSCLTGSVW